MQYTMMMLTTMMMFTVQCSKLPKKGVCFRPFVVGGLQPGFLDLPPDRLGEVKYAAFEDCVWKDAPQCTPRFLWL